MANVTVTSDFDYYIHINDGGDTPDGSKFELQEDGHGTTLSVNDSGVATVGGKFVSDVSPGVIFRCTNLGALDVVRYRRGTTGGSEFIIDKFGLSDARNVDTVLAATTLPPTGYQDGDMYWYLSGVTWYLRVRWGGAWTSLAAA